MRSYHGDICIGPSVSASDLHAMASSCPRLAWWRSYRNPKRPDLATPLTLLGEAAHALVLEGQQGFDRDVAVQPNGLSLRSNAGRAWADAQGEKILLTQSEAARVREMARLVREHNHAHAWIGTGDALREHSLFWIDPATRLWMKARPDVFNPASRLALDYKTTTSANPRAFERLATNLGYWQQAALALEGLAIVLGAYDLQFVFAVQELDPPHLTVMMQAMPRALEWGHEQNVRARQLWAECIAKGRWPAYRAAETPDCDAPISVGLPRWAEYEAAERREAPRLMTDAADPDTLRRAAELQAPINYTA